MLICMISNKNNFMTNMLSNGFLFLLEDLGYLSHLDLPNCFFKKCMCTCSSVSVPYMCSAHGCQQRASEVLKLQLHVIVSKHVGA